MHACDSASSACPVWLPGCQRVRRGVRRRMRMRTAMRVHGGTALRVSHATNAQGLTPEEAKGEEGVICLRSWEVAQPRRTRAARLATVCGGQEALGCSLGPGELPRVLGSRACANLRWYALNAFPAGVSIRRAPAPAPRSLTLSSFQVIYSSLLPFSQMFKSVLPTATRALRTSNLSATRSFHTTLSRMGVTVDVRRAQRWRRRGPAVVVLRVCSR